MCRLLGYLGPPIQLARLLEQPEHSLIIQSYQPREMTSGLLNADGFGVGWYHAVHDCEPFTYRNTQPIWSDINLAELSRYIESGCILASVRSATPGQAVQISNCQPFRHGSILATHNGYIENFRQTLYRTVRDTLDDAYYRLIDGTTDSEHIFALLLQYLGYSTTVSDVAALQAALRATVSTLSKWAAVDALRIGLNLIVSDGKQLVASRYASTSPAPTLYWLRDDPHFPGAVLVASEPLFASDGWTSCPENSFLSIDANLDVQIGML